MPVPRIHRAVLTLGLTAAAGAAAPRCVVAQSAKPAPAGKQTAPKQTEIRLTLSGQAAAPTLAGADGALDKPVEYDAAGGARMTVTCSAPLDCGKLSAARVGAAGSFGRSAPVDNAVTFTVPADAAATEAFPVRFTLDGKQASSLLTLQPTKAADGDDPPEAPSANDLAMIRCPRIPLAAGADFYLDGRGNLLAPPTRPLDEGDTVVVAIYADRRLHDQLRVRRSSATRQVVLTRILGEGTTKAELTREAFTEAVAPDCVPLAYTMADFASGEGKFEVAALGSGTATTLYEYAFKVNALYTGVLAFGPVRTTLRDFTFSKVYNGQDTVVTRSPTESGRVLYAVTYTPFVWGQRDLTVPPPRAREYMNPFIGFALNDVQKNAFAGISLELPARLYLSYGIHAGRVAVLDLGSGATVGGKFENRAADVPTQQRWSFKPFVGLSVDVLAAVQLLRAAASAPK